MDIHEVSTEALAYLGDSVIELKVRELLVNHGISDSGRLNSESLKYVKATSQAGAMQNIMDSLDENELSVFKRGRNHASGNVPKSATVAQYRIATGMEVLFGYLYLSGKQERINELFSAAFPDSKEKV